MIKKGIWVLLVISCILIGLYPIIYFIMGGNFGLRSSKSAELLANAIWNIGFYTHITLGGIALLTGWTQFGSKFRNRNLTLHRRIGKVYVFAVLISSTAGICIACFATGGLIPSVGFICLGVVWFSTTLMAYINIRNNRVEQHKRMMIYSYATCFAAVTLRIYLPLLVSAMGSFVPAYRIVAWLCWVPNLIVAYWIIRINEKKYDQVTIQA
ncbi:MAG: DUF2306 domain-containing protein [Bacteroidota bacterium]